MGERVITDQVVFLYCSDLGKTVSFYEGVLGFDLVVDQGSCRIVKVSDGGGGYLGYCERSVEGKSGRGVILTLVVAGECEVDEWHDYLSEQGVKIRDLPKLNPDYGIYHFFFNDPDGCLVEIQSFIDPSWREPVRQN